MSYFPQNLKYLRKTAHLSQEQLAEQLGLNRGNIASYEKGTAHPTIKKIINISKFFRIDVTTLYEKKIEGMPLYRSKEGVVTSVESLEVKTPEEKHTLQEQGAPLTVTELSKNAQDFKGAFEDFKEIVNNRHSTIKLVSKEIDRLTDDYGQLVNILEKMLHSNAILLDQLENLEAENKQLKAEKRIQEAD